MKLLVKKSQSTPTPSDPLANIDSTLVTGGKDRIVSPAEVRGAGERASLTPSPHRNTVHLGPHEWVHVAPDGGSTGRGSRVSGEEAPVPDKHVDSQYTLPEDNPVVHENNQDTPETAKAEPDSETNNAYEMAQKGFDFAHPHVARAATEGFLNHLSSMGREKEADMMRVNMRDEDRLSLYPWEIAKATDGYNWMHKNLPTYEGEASDQQDMEKSHVRFPHHGLPIPHHEYEVDPAELAERIKRRKEKQKKKRKLFFHPHKFRKDQEEIKESHVAEDTVDNEDDLPSLPVEEEGLSMPDNGATTKTPIEKQKNPEGLYIAKSASNAMKTKTQDVSPSHVYKQRDGRGYRNINVVPVGVPHGANARQEFPDPSWRLDANGQIGFSSRDFKRHPRHPHTILPLDPDEHGRQNLHMLHELSRHAHATADRGGDTNGFWDRLPTAEEVPFYPHDAGHHDIEAYETARGIQRGTEAAAHHNKIHSPAAESWRDYVKTIANAIEQHTGKHPEMHLLMRDLERMGSIMSQVQKFDDKTKEEHAQMRTIPLPGVSFMLQCDRRLIPPSEYAILDSADELMIQFSQRIGSAFKEVSVTDSREENSVQTQRRAWLQLSRDLQNSMTARHTEGQEVTPVLHTWSDSAKDGSGSPFFLLSQFHLSQNFSRLIPDKKQQIGQRHLGMTFQRYAKDVVKDLNLFLPDSVRNVRVVDYIDKIHPTVCCSLQQLPIILSEGVISPDTLKDASGISHASIVKEEKIGGLDHGVFLYDGERFGESAVTFILHPRVYEEDGVVGINSEELSVSQESHIDLRHKLYRPTRGNRALMHLYYGIEPVIAGERWADLVNYRYTLLRSQVTIIPRFISLVHVQKILLRPETPADIVESMRVLATKHNRHMQISVGTYHDSIASI